LENDLASRDELKHAINDITARLSGGFIEEHERTLEIAKAQRDHWVAELKRLRNELKLARSDEYRPIVIAGEDFDPAKAARFVADHSLHAHWIPSPIARGAPLPLGDDELAELYATNRLPEQDETELSIGIPDSSCVPSPDAVGRLMHEIEELTKQAKPSPERWVLQVLSTAQLDELKLLAENALEPLNSAGWLLQVIQDSRVDATALEDDMRRQEILERLGWTFVRIRGGEFFRHPDRAMEPVFEKLAELEITPTMGVSAPQPEDMRLRDEVIRRATEYRREWSKPAEIPLPRSDQEADEHASQPSRRERSRIHSLHTSKHRLYRPAMVARHLNKNLCDWLAMG
jgi:hypothetical protein